MNILLDEVNSKLDKTEERNTGLEVKLIKIFQTKAQTEKKHKLQKERTFSNHEIKSSNQTYVYLGGQKKKERLGQKGN